MSVKLTAKQLLKEVREIKKANFSPPKIAVEGWERFYGSKIPNAVLETIEQWEDWDPWETGGSVVQLWYKGDDPKTAEEYIVVTNDGDYYESGAQYMVWSDHFALVARSRIEKDKLIQRAKRESN